MNRISCLFFCPFVYTYTIRPTLHRPTRLDLHTFRPICSKVTVKPKCWFSCFFLQISSKLFHIEYLVMANYVYFRSSDRDKLNYFIEIKVITALRDLWDQGLMNLLKPDVQWYHSVQTLHGQGVWHHSSYGFDCHFYVDHMSCHVTMAQAWNPGHNRPGQNPPP